MRENVGLGRPGLGAWAAMWVGLVGMELTVARAVPDSVVWAQPTALFGIVVVAASLCVVAAVGVLLIARRDALPELGLIGSFFYAVSVLPLVHGLTTPGVLYGPNQATSASVFWALPLASVVTAPLALTGRRRAAVLRRWRGWIGANVAAHTGLAALLLVRPGVLPFAPMSSRTAVSVAVVSLIPCLVLSARHLRLYWIGRASGSFVVAMGFALVGAANLVWVGRAPFTVGFWLAHLLDISGVLAATVFAARTYRQGTFTRNVIAPLVADDPVSAFELGLDPVVHRFVADLERKDPITRDHVVRTCALALEVGAALNLPAPQLRTLGLAALLHDVGKLEIADAILSKPGKLDADEYAEMQRHPALGESLVRESRVLADIAPLVRAHHERVDGTGYPDGLADDAIPLLARIVSVCDGFDAMAHTRQYRQAMGTDQAMAVLQEHAGAQWDDTVVAKLVAMMKHTTMPERPAALAGVGRPLTDICACIDALPPALARR